jgi:hypothetical protein
VSFRETMQIPKFKMGRPQRYAAILLLCFFGQCLWLSVRTPMSGNDYDYARCGREMWEKPSPLAGYFTSCGNMQDGTAAYRAAGLPLTLQRITLGFASGANPWEMRHELSYVNLLVRLPFILIAVWLGGALWWVSRRLYGNEGGFLALAMYCFSPLVLRAAIAPNNEIIAMWGLYGIVYTAIGVAHAMQGPRKKWRPRIALLALAFGVTASAHIIAAFFGLVLALVLMMYLAERRRGDVLQVLTITTIAAFVVLFASYAFRPGALLYVFSGGEARSWLTLTGFKYLFTNPLCAGFYAMLAVALMFAIAEKRSRYFGNIAPLCCAAVLIPLMTTVSRTQPWLWALPFLFTFAGGVFADLLETRQRKFFLRMAGALVVVQIALAVVNLWQITQSK